MDMNSTIEQTIHQLCDVAENDNPKAFNLINAVGEIVIKNVNYQIQISLVADKKVWIDPNDVTFSEIVKVHD